MIEADVQNTKWNRKSKSRQRTMLANSENTQYEDVDGVFSVIPACQTVVFGAFQVVAAQSLDSL